MRGFLIDDNTKKLAIVLESELEFSALSAALADRAMNAKDIEEMKFCTRLHDELNRAWLAAYPRN